MVLEIEWAPFYLILVFLRVGYAELKYVRRCFGHGHAAFAIIMICTNEKVPAVHIDDFAVGPLLDGV